VDTDGTAARTGGAGATAPVPVPKAAHPPTPPATAPAPAAAVTTAGGVMVPPAGTRPAGSVTERPATPDPRAGSGMAAPATTGVSAPVAAPRPTGPRRARLLLTRLDPWSVMKTAFMLSISIGIVLLIATALLWWTLDVTGVFAAVGRTIDDVAGSGTTSFDFLSLVGFSRVMGVALVLTAIEVVLGSALATLFAFLYNLSVGLTGGLEVTLSEDS
jgi:hypothetical protein